MGARKRLAAEKRKEALKTQYFAKLRSSLKKQPLRMLKNFCVRLSPTGNRKTSVKLKMANCS